MQSGLSSRSRARSGRKGSALLLALSFGGLAAVVLLIGSPNARPSPTQRSSQDGEISLAESHRVNIGGTTYAISYEVDNIVLRRLSPAPSAELVRTTVPGAARPSAVGAPLLGSAQFALVCPEAGSTVRFWFGQLQPATRDIAYTGPAAVGQGSGDGLFLYVLTAPTISSGDVLKVSNGTTSLSVGGSAFEGLGRDGETEPSGCRLSIGSALTQN